MMIENNLQLDIASDSYQDNSFALLVPCYNAERYVPVFLANIAKLKRAFNEVIFYDDASTDQTALLLKTAGFRVITGEQNKGPGFARNQLVVACNSNWFHFHDIDDEMNEDYLLQTAAVANTNTNVDVVLCNVDWVEPESKERLISWTYSNLTISEDSISYTISHPIGGINGLYKKLKFIKTGGFDTSIRIWEDADLHVKLAQSGAKFHVIEQVLCRSLRYSSSASADQRQGWLIRLSLLANYHQIFGNKRHQVTIGKQAQIVAGNFILLGQVKAAKKALELSESCGVGVPDNKSLIWTLFKWTMPKSLRIYLRILQLKNAFKPTLVLERDY